MAKIIPFEKIQELYNSYKKIAEDYGITNKKLTSKDIVKINSFIDHLSNKDLVKEKYNIYPILESVN